MDRSVRLRLTLTSTAVLGVLALFGVFGASCGFAPTPVPVVGPGVSGNDVPTLDIIEPGTDITRGQGDPLLIRWTDSDRDDNASIAYALLNTATNERILLIEGIEENDTTGPDSVTISTGLVPEGAYNLVGTIDDGTNAPVEAFASTTVAGATPRRLIVRVVGQGEGGVRTQPPQVAVVAPDFNQSVSQDDILTVTVQPTELAPDASLPFDVDSDITLFLLLDTDTNPNNDDPSNPGPSDIILLQTQTIQQGSFEPITFTISIDLNVVPPRATGDPYFIRATVDDGTNPRVHQYAVGAISVVRLAAGLVDLFDIGRVSSGARFYGFSPGANVGSSITSISDFDADGVDDFLIVAQFGNARNFGPIGEAYGIYGTANTRFGGSIAVNSVSDTISGVVFEAPPVRTGVIPDPDAHTDGITSASWVPDLTGDGRPDLLFGLRHVHGAIESMDYDPADETVSSSDSVDIEVVIRQGQVTVAEGDATPEVTSVFFSGVDDTTLDSAQPNVSFGSSGTIGWLDNGVGQRKWALIKFSDVRNQLPDNLDTIDIASVSVTLEFDVANTGGNGQVREAFTDFNESTTFSTFAVNDGEPEEGLDYSADDMGNITTTDFGTVTVDVSDLVRTLLAGQLSVSNNELRFIILPATGADANDEAEVRSSETSTTSQRPILRVGYSRINRGGNAGCYPDQLVNNLTTQGSVDRDNYWTAGGIVLLVDSDNRDNSPTISGATRLESTSISLELVGQSSDVILSGSEVDNNGSIFSRADDGNDVGRIAGARFMAGPFDWVDAFRLGQSPRAGLFGDKVATIGDLNNDGVPEIVVSAPRNELHLQELFAEFGFQSTHFANTEYEGSITVFPGNDYNAEFWRDKQSSQNAATSIPTLDNVPRFGTDAGGCASPATPRVLFVPRDVFDVFAEDVTDMLGGASTAGDFNQDGIDDLLCGAYLNDRGAKADTGAVYILYGRTILGNFDLKNADDALLRAPMLRIRGVKEGDRIGWVQASGLDVNGDRIDDVFFGSPFADFGGITRSTCGGDFNGDGRFDNSDLNVSSFTSCRVGFGTDVFSNDPCKVFDYDNDGDIDDDDDCVFKCLSGGAVGASCTVGLDANDCCAHMVDNGFVGIVFGGVFTDGDRDITQIATTDLRGTRFFGAAAGHRAGFDVSSAGDFNEDGFGDLLIVTPGETRLDSAGRERLGVVYLVFGGPHLENTEWNLKEVGSVELPGIVFLSPYVKGRPNEAPPLSATFIGDINDDGFDDIAIGNPKADFIDLSFPQGPDAPGGDAAVGRRRNAGDAYIIYGNNFGSNRGAPGG